MFYPRKTSKLLSLVQFSFKIVNFTHLDFPQWYRDSTNEGWITDYGPNLSSLDRDTIAILTNILTISGTLPLLFCEKSTIFRLFPDRVPTELFRSDLQSVQVQTKENTTISSTRKLFGLVVQSFQVQNHRNLGPTHNPKIIRNHFIKFPS